MATSYKSRLEKLGFYITENEVDGVIIFDGHHIGHWDESRKIKIGVRSDYRIKIIKSSINAAEILEKERIPYTFVTLNENKEAFEREISERQTLIGRLNALNPQHKQ